MANFLRCFKSPRGTIIKKETYKNPIIKKNMNKFKIASENRTKKNFDPVFHSLKIVIKKFLSQHVRGTGFLFQMNFESSRNINFWPSYPLICPPLISKYVKSGALAPRWREKCRTSFESVISETIGFMIKMNETISVDNWLTFIFS